MAGYEDRKRLTFEQAEGAESIPSQLELKEVTQELRAGLWQIVWESISESTYTELNFVGPPWLAILRDEHVKRLHLFVDDFDHNVSNLRTRLRALFSSGDYLEIFGFLQWVLRHRECPVGFPAEIGLVLRRCRAAYTLIDADTIVPVGSEAERETVKLAFADLALSEFHGARSHLRDASAKLTEGDYPGSIRDSIHAVEALARSLEPSAKLSTALAMLEKSVRVHPALKAGFDKLYGFTSDERGIRHPLIDGPVAQVDETDALYMLGSCAAFVSYLINKALNAGLLPVT